MLDVLMDVRWSLDNLPEDIWVLAHDFLWRQSQNFKVFISYFLAQCFSLLVALQLPQSDRVVVIKYTLVISVRDFWRGVRHCLPHFVLTALV
ncbi:hypothetical protein D9M70_491720 [compost metagenome]